MSLCGMDEAGRGCIAGPLVIAGVILEKEIEGLNDSKKLTPKKREELYQKILEGSKYLIVVFSSGEVDEYGLSKCLGKGIKEIRETLQADRYLMDGNTNFGNDGVDTEVKADSKYQEVSAASILAKVTKDKTLVKDGEKYPEFTFASHQGYGTKNHIEEISKHGLTPLHRKSFKIKSIDNPSLF
ncbi:MAG: ribonuclease HII [Campylobacterales bacterium]|nr:ribonuclease HII [Campylobacterales bacterium]